MVPDARVVGHGEQRGLVIARSSGKLCVERWFFDDEAMGPNGKSISDLVPSPGRAEYMDLRHRKAIEARRRSNRSCAPGALGPWGGKRS